jgi:hypothetical protein
MASTFAIDVKQFGAKTIAKARLVRRVVGLDVFGRIVRRTPVGNPDLWKSKRAPPGYVGGRLRGNWQASVGSPAEGELDLRGEGAVQMEVGGVMAAWPDDGSVFLTNNLPYAEAIEMGHSRLQAPAGMVRVTLTEYPGIVEKRTREVKDR